MYLNEEKPAVPISEPTRTYNNPLPDYIVEKKIELGTGTSDNWYSQNEKPDSLIGNIQAAFSGVVGKDQPTTLKNVGSSLPLEKLGLGVGLGVVFLLILLFIGKK